MEKQVQRRKEYVPQFPDRYHFARPCEHPLKPTSHFLERVGERYSPHVLPQEQTAAYLELQRVDENGEQDVLMHILNKLEWDEIRHEHSTYILNKATDAIKNRRAVWVGVWKNYGMMFWLKEDAHITVDGNKTLKYPDGLVYLRIYKESGNVGTVLFRPQYKYLSWCLPAYLAEYLGRGVDYFIPEDQEQWARQDLTSLDATQKSARFSIALQKGDNIYEQLLFIQKGFIPSDLEQPNPLPFMRERGFLRRWQQTAQSFEQYHGAKAQYLKVETISQKEQKVVYVPVRFLDLFFT